MDCGLWPAMTSQAVSTAPRRGLRRGCAASTGQCLDRDALSGIGWRHFAKTDGYLFAQGGCGFGDG